MMTMKGKITGSGANDFSADLFAADVYEIIGQIPKGRVVSYKDVARLAGWPNHSRLVGRILSECDSTGVPCHRVVTSAGRLSPVFAAQRQRLEAEGVKFTKGGNVDMRRFRWQFETDQSILT